MKVVFWLSSLEFYFVGFGLRSNISLSVCLYVLELALRVYNRSRREPDHHRAPVVYLSELFCFTVCEIRVYYVHVWRLQSCTFVVNCLLLKPNLRFIKFGSRPEQPTWLIFEKKAQDYIHCTLLTYIHILLSTVHVRILVHFNSS